MSKMEIKATGERFKEKKKTVNERRKGEGEEMKTDDIISLIFKGTIHLAVHAVLSDVMFPSLTVSLSS